MKKYCSRCKKLQLSEAFGRHKGRWDKRAAWCLSCCRVYHRARYARYARMRGDAARPRSAEEPHA